MSNVLAIADKEQLSIPTLFIIYTVSIRTIVRIFVEITMFQLLCFPVFLRCRLIEGNLQGILK